MVRARAPLILGLKILITVIPCYFVFHNIVKTPGMDSGDFQDLIRSIRYAPLFFAVLCLFLSTLSGCIQWRLLLRKQNIEMGYLKLLKIYYVGLFFNNFMPGNVGGDLKKIYDIRVGTEETVGAAVSATVFDRLFGLYFLNVFALVVGFLFFIHDPEQRYFWIPSFWVFVGFTVFQIALFSRRFSRLISAIAMKILPQRWGIRFCHLQERFHNFRDLRLWIAITFLSGITQTLRVLVHFCCGIALGLDIAVSWYFYYIPMIAVISALPISIGGFGPRELLAQTLFARAGVGTMESVMVQLLAYLAGLSLSLVGAFEFLRRKKSIK